MKILICGFMGAGKTTFLKKFQPNELGFECIDLDEALANQLGLHPNRLGEWILQNGFPLFRDLEKTKIKELLRHSNNMIIALGGGSLSPEILSLIHNNSEYKLVFLETSLEVCLARIKNDPNRPLAQIPEGELRKLYEMRLADYLTADLVLNEEERKEIVTLSSLVHNLD
jgi:shikimate kinase